MLTKAPWEVASEIDPDSHGFFDMRWLLSGLDEDDRKITFASTVDLDDAERIVVMAAFLDGYSNEFLLEMGNLGALIALMKAQRQIAEDSDGS